MSQQPTFHITKEHFVGVINSLREQYCKDKDYAADIGRIFNSDGSGFYDNSALINSIFSFLHEAFPKDEDGHSEIEHYCYVLSFGRNGDDYESPEELYGRLVFKSFEKFNSKNFADFSRKIDLELWEKGRKEYPIAPEDAFLPTQEMQDLANVIVIEYPAANEDDSCFATLTTELKGIYMSDTAFEDKFPSSHWIRRPFKRWPGLINSIPDHSGLVDKIFPSNPPDAIYNATDHSKTTIEHFRIGDWEKGKPSPDETA